MDCGSSTTAWGLPIKAPQPAPSIASQIAPTGLFNPKQAAQYLGIEPGTLAVWRSTNRRVLPYVKVGSQVRYRREDLDTFISQNLHCA